MIVYTVGVYRREWSPPVKNSKGSRLQSHTPCLIRAPIIPPRTCYAIGKGRTGSFFDTMRSAELEAQFPNYIRAHRRRTGLSQRELAQVLGYPNEYSIARHEQFLVMPPLEIAIGYERIFNVPVSELFAGLSEEMTGRIEAGLARLEEGLGQRSAMDRNALATARKLAWLAERRDGEVEMTP